MKTLVRFEISVMMGKQVTPGQVMIPAEEEDPIGLPEFEQVVKTGFIQHWGTESYLDAETKTVITSTMAYVSEVGTGRIFRLSPEDIIIINDQETVFDIEVIDYVVIGKDRFHVIFTAKDLELDIGFGMTEFKQFFEHEAINFLYPGKERVKTYVTYRLGQLIKNEGKR